MKAMERMSLYSEAVKMHLGMTAAPTTTIFSQVCSGLDRMISLSNILLGTAVIAQAGVILIVASVWAANLQKPLMVFTAHPLLSSASLIFLVQAILFLQPTRTTLQKRRGTIFHFSLISLTVVTLIAGLAFIEYNKISHDGLHFKSPHAILGLITHFLIGIQALFGTTAYFAPRLYGSEGKAKSLYKWHRLSGYILLVVILATVCAATQTDYNIAISQIKLWAVILYSIMILVGVVKRIKKEKFGFQSK
jgi:hypothetical protein